MHAHYSNRQQWLQAALQAYIGPSNMPNGMLEVVVVDASSVASYLLNESRNGKDWTAIEPSQGQVEGVSINVPLRSK